ncbi:MAG TPA: tyrosine--tRNA ligase [Candidatus Bilamarchaeum sp.]|nr:tyrosine--tRNA ligase [Candidatus Bilamarchaeum sp.]
MDIETKVGLVKRAPLEEIVTEDDLRKVFQNYSHPKHYIGFEISGMVHLGTGLCTSIKLKDFLQAGIKPTIFLADYHSYINQKLGGDLEKIREVAKGYFKHCFVSLGLEEGKVDFVLASDLYDSDYWKTVLKISKDTTINRMLRCITIMGRKESEATSSAAILYPAMQAADIFMLDVQIAHAGLDQRKVHMLARELAHSYKREFVAVHHHLLPGLQVAHAPAAGQHPASKEEEVLEKKMSKSIPGSAIFIHDTEDEIRAKIKKAHCPEKIAEGNPVIEYAEYLVLRDKKLKIERPAKFGGDIEIAGAAELKSLFSEGKLHPMDLKNAVARELVELLRPSREYFAKNRHYLEQIAAKDVTR